MTMDQILAADPGGMYNRLASFPSQVRDAVAIAGSTPIRLRAKGIEQIVLCGLGGSAIGGDLLRSYLADQLRIPFLVNRSYVLPRFVGLKTLVIVSSYSGSTEESVACYREAVKRRAKILCITSGGTVERMARKYKHPVIMVPGGLPPRSALGYSFFPLLITLSKAGFVPDPSRAVRETISVLETLTDEYRNPDNADNAPLRLAEQARERICVVYTAAERFDSVGTRWRGQISENAKSLVFGNVVPEMNHNELVGWKVLKEPMQAMQVFFLRDAGDHPRVARRLDITRRLVGDHTSHIAEVWSRGKSPLARMFSLISLGDWLSLYLAILHGEDPTPVDVITYLKTELGKL
jgi:glucose/mannose-6-phosphate isomerase